VNLILKLEVKQIAKFSNYSKLLI